MEWLGDVPTHWEVAPLGRIGRFFKGNGGTKADETEEGVPCVRYGDLYTSHDYHIASSKACVAPDVAATTYTPIKFGDVLFAGSGETIDEIGKSAANIMVGPACCGGDVIVFRPRVRADARFLGYATDCQPAARQKARMGRGFTVIHIYGNNLKFLAIAIPPVPEQTAIARFLDHATSRIDRYIRAKRKLVALLEEHKQAMIHQALTGQIDVRTGRSYLAYKDSGVPWVGRVPEHWQLVRLGRLIELTVGFPFKSDSFSLTEGDVRLLRGINVAPGRLRWADMVRWPVVEMDAFAEYRIEVGDIILGMDRPIVGGGIRVAVATETDTPSLLLQRVARIRPAEKKLLREFAFQILSSRNFMVYLAPLFTGISVPHLSPEQIRGFLLGLPNPDEQEGITKYLDNEVNRIQSAIHGAQAQIALLRDYRTRLIADVVTGKRDVRSTATELPNTGAPASNHGADADGAQLNSHDTERGTEEVIP